MRTTLFKKKFCVKLAGIPLEIRAKYTSTRHLFRDYLSDETPVLSITVSTRELRKEQQYSARQREQEGKPPARYSSRHLETLALCRKIAAQLLPKGALLFHGTVIAKDGKAYVFTAPSGTGKTTHAQLWLQHIEDCHILNGDKPFLLFRNGTVYACGSPWTGKENYGKNEMLPLEAICVLEQSPENHIEHVSLKDNFDILLNQSYIPEKNDGMIAAIRLIQQLSTVNLYRLSCNISKEAAFVAYNAMVKQ